MCATKKHFIFVLGWLCFACIPELPMRAQEQTKDSSKLAIFGSGHGLDHVGIAVRDLAAAKKTYRDILGFKVFGCGRLPVGTRNEIVFLESGFFEIITSSDPTKSDGRAVASFLEKHEGGLFLGLKAAPVEETAKLLRKQGYDIQGPNAGWVSDDPEQPDQPPFWGTWHLAGFATGPVPAGHLPARSTDAISLLNTILLLRRFIPTPPRNWLRSGWASET
jgi:catechol 2,3-dioxygenase-like lactoylglutathione lyase family enzyme